MEKCEHEWVYDGEVCCGFRLECRKCGRGTKVRKITGSPKIGDPMVIREDGGIAERIGTRLSF